MYYTGLFKRIVPFVLTFAAGLFIASFFVSLPSFGGWRSARRDRRCGEHRELRREMQELRNKYNVEVEENSALRRQLENTDVMLESEVPLGMENLHHPPPPPRRPKHPR